MFMALNKQSFKGFVYSYRAVQQRPNTSLHGHAGVHFDVKEWSPKIDIHLFKEPKNSPIF